MRTILPLVATLFVAANWAVGEESPDLDDSKVRELIAKKAVLIGSLDDRGPDGEELFYQASSESPYTGWAKGLHKNGQLGALCYIKDGKPEGPAAAWHENGQKSGERHYKDGKPDGLWIKWHENGKKRKEAHYKGGKPDGLWVYWDGDGKVVKKVRYKDGEVTKE